MTFNEIMNKQAEVLKSVFDDNSLEITKETSAEDIDEWDSLTHIQVISEIEAAFKIRFALGELQALKNVGEMAELIQKKIA